MDKTYNSWPPPKSAARYREYVAHEGDADLKMGVCAECAHDYLLWQLVDDLCEDCARIEDLERIADKKAIKRALKGWVSLCSSRTRTLGRAKNPKWADPALLQCHRDLRVNVFGGSLEDDKGNKGAWELLAKLGLILRQAGDDE